MIKLKINNKNIVKFSKKNYDATQHIKTWEIQLKQYLGNMLSLIRIVKKKMESKNNTNECICKTETDSQIQKTNLWLPKGRGKQGGTN